MRFKSGSGNNASINEAVNKFSGFKTDRIVNAKGFSYLKVKTIQFRGEFNFHGKVDIIDNMSQMNFKKQKMCRSDK